MKEKMMSRLPLVYAFYSIIIFVSCIYNAFLGNVHMETRWFIELFGFLIVFFVFEQLFQKLHFNSFFLCAVAETSLAYVLFLIFGYIFKWVSFVPAQLLRASILFVLIAAIGIFYMNYQHKLRTREINELLQKKNI